MFHPKIKFTYDEKRLIIFALIDLKNRLLEEGRYNGTNNIYENPLTGSETSYTWKGAKTPFRQINGSSVTSNEVVTLTTNESGFTEAIKIPKNAGTYTCKEVMTTAQARKYRIVSVNPQTITAPEGESAVCFMKQYYQSRNSEWKLEPVIYAKTVKQIQCYRFFQDNR